MFCKIILYSQVIVKSTIDPDYNLNLNRLKKSCAVHCGCERVKDDARCTNKVLSCRKAAAFSKCNLLLSGDRIRSCGKLAFMIFLVIPISGDDSVLGQGWSERAVLWFW